MSLITKYQQVLLCHMQSRIACVRLEACMVSVIIYWNRELGHTPLITKTA